MSLREALRMRGQVLWQATRKTCDSSDSDITSATENASDASNGGGDGAGCGADIGGGDWQG